ncbi:regenerating islet-derived protein 4 [Prionailurus iriomotensis]
MDIIMRPSCAAGWFYYKSNCYGYFRKLRTWSEAEDSINMDGAGDICPDPRYECQLYGNGAHLASLQNAKEANTVAKYISGYQKTKPVWIGLHDPQKSQKWQWIDGAFYLYRKLSAKSAGGNKYCVEMNSREV